MKDRLIAFAREDWPLLVALAAVVVITLVAYPSLPASVPTHWNWRGQPDGFSPKAIAAVLMPAIAAGTYAVVALFLALDPKKRWFEEGSEAMSIFRMLGPAFLLALHLLMVVVWLTDQAIDFTGILYAGVGLMYAVMGNFMAKVRPNYVVGIRLPWTLEDEVVWRSTHRMAGPIWFIGGLSLMAAPLLGSILQFVYFLAISTVLVVVPAVHAYRLYHQRHPEGDSSPS